ncbi:bifunctional phosphoribosyl-AMP cyclohydrolase/phosphoribosyl-ATP diphosphatase HisIE [Hydrogenivirga sp. 128-5-R1-1]|uniref:bifunctional phosphoribosyl-AMP cyclohydrolase/phosphoribosyl-ATP diphosphatase HisIE n=1 Tax=Hydrogenivirga sp. 128-5-R1-1 TaxID=392423 RepID=UPI00015F192A|nr:bifunctional phosphoribosyl-AMP cyclohydrolase/phosphoribosyl-ATP diphosphatase HisIE [Hydrogenivirga sp. 128-5-R1-1]EDP75494.1 phosphoribosyl-ATP pyrophosphohydrolase [Hydrogenivirga sp. 128-5-R1-1]
MLKLNFNEEGLIPVIAQDYRTGEIRMFAWANEEAIRKTLETGYAHYYSRSRKELWKKGETSGELQRVREVRVDCDEDVLMYVIEQEKNRACHTGERNCFYRNIEGDRIDKPLPFEALPRLQEIIRDRLEKKPEDSYTIKLAQKGLDKVIQKFGEEAVETLIALKNEDRGEVLYETADMLYMLTLALTMEGIDVSEVMEELIKRMK